VIHTYGNMTIDFDDLLAVFYDEKSEGVRFTFKTGVTIWYPLGYGDYFLIADAWKELKKAPENP
jgi:hypothetical protein